MSRGRKAVGGTHRMKGSLSLLELWRLKDNSLRNQIEKKIKKQKTHCAANMSVGLSLAIT